MQISKQAPTDTNHQAEETSVNQEHDGGLRKGKGKKSNNNNINNNNNNNNNNNHDGNFKHNEI